MVRRMILRQVCHITRISCATVCSYHISIYNLNIMEPMKAQMTPEELAEMKGLQAGFIHKDAFEAGYRMGFIAGKLSALTHITNHSTLLNGDITAGEAEPTGLGKKRVAAKGKEGRL
jgi:hypothetical protein